MRKKTLCRSRWGFPPPARTSGAAKRFIKHYGGDRSARSTVRALITHSDQNPITPARERNALKFLKTVKIRRTNPNNKIKRGSFVFDLFNRGSRQVSAKAFLNAYAEAFARKDKKGNVVPVEDGTLLFAGNEFNDEGTLIGKYGSKRHVRKTLVMLITCSKKNPITPEQETNAKEFLNKIKLEGLDPDVNIEEGSFLDDLFNRNTDNYQVSYYIR